MTKRSVADNPEILAPLRILQMAKACFDEPFIAQDDRLPHAAYVCLGYLGAFRINEELPLLKSQFKVRASLEKREFLVITNATILKSATEQGGTRRLRNVALYPNDPITIPVRALLASLPEDARLFQFAETTARKFLDRATQGYMWPHFFKAQRDRFLAQAFHKEERDKIIGWADTRPARERSFRSTGDIYASLNWLWYADRLAKLTESYWDAEPLPPDVNNWLYDLIQKYLAPNMPPDESLGQSSEDSGRDQQADSN